MQSFEKLCAVISGTSEVFNWTDAGGDVWGMIVNVDGM